MARVCHYGRGRSLLHDVAEIHDCNAVAQTFHRHDVVRNEQVRNRHAALKRAQQTQDFLTDRGVKRRGRFVKYDKLRAGDQRPRNTHSLLFACRQFDRKTIQILRPETHSLQHRGYHAEPGAGRCIALQGERLLDGLPHCPARVQRGERILKHHLQARPQRLEFPLRQSRNVGALEANTPARWLNQAKQTPADRRLSRSAFPDEPESLSPADLKADPIDSTDIVLALKVEALDQPFDGNQGICHRTIFEDVSIVAAALMARKSAAAISLRVTAWRGANSTSRTDPISTIRPSCRTATRLQYWATIPSSRVARTWAAPLW